LISEKITIFIAIWIILSLFITGDMDLEIFFVLVLIGFIVIKELTDRFTASRFKIKMNALISVFMIVFIVIVGRRIINFLGI